MSCIPLTDALALLDGPRERRRRRPPCRTRSATPRVAWLPRAHRDREVRLLERQHVVHAVTDHRDVVAAARSAVDDALLQGGRDPTEDRRLSMRPGRARRRRGRRARDRRSTRSSPVRPAWRASVDDGLGVVARDDLDRHAGLDEPGERLRGVGRSTSRSATRPRARMPCGQRGLQSSSVGGAGRGVGVRRDREQHAQPARHPTARQSIRAPPSQPSRRPGRGPGIRAGTAPHRGRRSRAPTRPDRAVAAVDGAVAAGAARTPHRARRPPTRRPSRSTSAPTRTAPPRRAAAPRRASAWRSPRSSGCRRSRWRRGR